MKPKRSIKIARKPIYPGGSKAMHRYIMDNLMYPKEALEHKIEGYVVVRYDINYKGKVIKTKIIKSLGYGCDKEVKRLVGLLKFDVPKSRNMKLIFHKTTRIPFKINISPKIEEPIAQISYNFVPTKATPQKSMKSRKGIERKTYNYTIKIDEK